MKNKIEEVKKLYKERIDYYQSRSTLLEAIKFASRGTLE